MGKRLDLLGLLYPRTCPVCQKKLNFSGKLSCAACESGLKLIKEPRCMKCGKNVEDETIEYCFDCVKNQHVYDYGRSLFLYNEDIRKSIYRFKYAGKKEYGDFYGYMLARHLGEEIRNMGCDLIVPVPLHKKKEIKRGYNQAAVIAKVMGRELCIPVDDKLLIRTKNTRPQKEMDKSERKKNVENAFKINKDIVKCKGIVLVDDIYTTGSTIDAVARILKGDGVKEVYFICLCTSGVN